MDIKEIREKIDIIDQKILNLIKERFDVLPDVLKYKIDNNLKIVDEIREKEVINNKLEKAKLLGLSLDFTKNLFEMIMKESVSIQNILKGKKK